jgi:hypothetical protein
VATHLDGHADVQLPWEVVGMRRGVAAWVRLSTLVSVVAFAAMLAMFFTLMLVHGLVWREGIEEPTALHQLLFLALAVPFLALPGVAAARAVRVTGWWFARIVLGSAGFGLGAVVLADAATVPVWAAMVVGTLLGVVWAPAGREASADPTVGDGIGGPTQPPVSSTPDIEHQPLLLDPPLQRLVPRDVLEPPEGWEVPETLPHRRSVTAGPGDGAVPTVGLGADQAGRGDDQLTSR